MFYNSISTAVIFLIVYTYYWMRYWHNSFTKLIFPILSVFIGFAYGFIAGIVPCISLII